MIDFTQHFDRQAATLELDARSAEELLDALLASADKTNEIQMLEGALRGMIARWEDEGSTA